MLAGLSQSSHRWTSPVRVDGLPHSAEHLFHSVSIHFGPLAITLGGFDVCRTLDFLLFLFRLPRAEVICARWVVSYMENISSRVCWGVKGIFGLGFCLF